MTPADSILVVYAMFDVLTQHAGDFERMRGVMRDTLPPSLYEFLTPDTGRFDSPLVDDEIAQTTTIPQPKPSIFVNPKRENPRRMTIYHHRMTSCSLRGRKVDRTTGPSPGRTPNTGRRCSPTTCTCALRSLHLVPHPVFVPERRAIGVSLPGVPGLVCGSNGTIAWAFTASYADCQDLVVIEVDPDDPDQYRTEDGFIPFDHVRDEIIVKNKEPEVLELRRTKWGVVNDVDLHQRPLVTKWTALEPDAVNLRLLDMLFATDFDEAVEIGGEMNMPSQNVVLGGEGGRIAAVVSGWLPRRQGFDGTVPVSWADPPIGWSGPIDAEARPKIIDPADGIIFTANNRVFSLETARRYGNSWALGARAQRIGEVLRSQPKWTEAEFLALQLDIRSSVHDFYRDLVLDTIAPEDSDPRLQQFREQVRQWDGQASQEQIGFRILRDFRILLHQQVLAPLLAACRAADPDFRYRWPLAEEPIRTLLEKRPPHLLATEFDDWPGLIRQTLIRLADDLQQIQEPYGMNATWVTSTKSPSVTPFLSRPSPIFSTCRSLRSPATSTPSAFKVGRSEPRND